jgi:hypothetical protein
MELLPSAATQRHCCPALLQHCWGVARGGAGEEKRKLITLQSEGGGGCQDDGQ